MHIVPDKNAQIKSPCNNDGNKTVDLYRLSKKLCRKTETGARPSKDWLKEQFNTDGKVADDTGNSHNLKGNTPLTSSISARNAAQIKQEVLDQVR